MCLKCLSAIGYSALNITALAKEIGCSTQPISWHFGNMDGLRKELSKYALSYANDKMRSSYNNGIEAFANVGIAYVNIAFDEFTRKYWKTVYAINCMFAAIIHGASDIIGEAGA